MTPLRNLLIRATFRVLAAALALTLPLMPGQALAQGGRHAVKQVAVERPPVQRLEMSIGASQIIELSRDAKEVFVGNPGVANAVVRSARKIFLIGVANGATSVYVSDADGQQIAAFEIVVGRDLSVLRQMLRDAIPSGQLDVRPAGDSVLLTGVVDTPLQAKQAEDIANAFVGQSSTGGANTSGSGISISLGSSSSTSGKVINAISVRGKDQVMLKVSVAEVQRTTLKQLGINTNGNWNIGKYAIAAATSNPFSIAGGALSDTLISATGNFAPGQAQNISLQALERAGVMRVLAEPTLTATSGETATFLVGGQIPLPTGSNCTPSGGITTCALAVTLHPFGVALTFTPIVMAEGRISVRVATEVSEIDSSISLQAQGISIPGFRVRKSETVVELPSGGTLATAGLIQQTSKQAINGVPGLLNLPVLGTLFRSRDYQRQETELMISVTPYIAKPVNPGDITRPDDGFVDASDPQTILLGRLNKLYGITGAGAPNRSYSGHAGFITD
jgi:pilus assembly protein CpaC